MGASAAQKRPAPGTKWTPPTRRPTPAKLPTRPAMCTAVTRRPKKAQAPMATSAG